MPNKPTAALVLALAGLASAPAAAGTCHMTMQGAVLLDDAPCAFEGRKDDARVALDGGGSITVRHATLVATLPGRPRPDGTRRLFRKSFGRVIASGEADTSLCYFNQKATLCVDP